VCAQNGPARRAAGPKATGTVWPPPWSTRRRRRCGCWNAARPAKGGRP
jgi:hypothetical protein